MTTSQSGLPQTVPQHVQPVHVCLLGPSGIGKSPLSSLFKLSGFDPLRVRPPRDKKDELLCIAEADAAELFSAQTAKNPTPWPGPKKAPPNWFVVGDRWLFLGVGGDRQCLQFEDDEGRAVLRSQKRIEVFGPRLLDILKLGSQSEVGLSPENLVVLLLNPGVRTYDQMGNAPDPDVKEATFYAVTKRTELQHKPVDLPDAQQRVSRIPDELPAWVEIKNMVGNACIEFTSWRHFEFRYHQPNGNATDARRELLSARDLIMKKLYEAAATSPVVRAFLDSNAIRSPEEILELDDIV